MLVFTQTGSRYIARTWYGTVGKPTTFDRCAARCKRLAELTGEHFWPERV